MTKYEPVTVARVRAIFLWTLLLMPLALFILALVISLVFKGYSKTVSEVKEFISGIEVIPAIAYLIVFASAFTLILVFVNLINNYRWKKFFTSDAINAMRAYDFTFDHEGIDGLYKGVRVAIRYFISKDTESAYVHLLKDQSIPRTYTQLEHHDFGKDYIVTDYGDALVVEVNIKGKRRKKELDFQKIIERSIKFAETQHIGLTREVTGIIN